MHAYVLMRNHYHLLLETPRGGLSRAMHYLNSTYTAYFNRKHERAGHLFQGRYKNILIEKDRYFLAVSRYVHLNPVRAAVVEMPEDYEWSSYPQYVAEGWKSDWLCCDFTLEQFSRSRAQARRLYRDFVEEALASEENPFEQTRSGFVLGDEGFVDEIGDRVAGRTGRKIPQITRGVREFPRDDIVRLVAERFAIHEEELRKPRSSHSLARKMCIYLLRKHAGMTNDELSGFFGTGHAGIYQTVSRIRRQLNSDKELGSLIEGIEHQLQAP